MPDQWKQNDGTFHLGINMAGAVSAGAYTAGVLDFLTEALEQWYAAKAQANPAVPLHNLSIDVFSGASAGGMCAAIASVMVQGDFEHITDPTVQAPEPTTNKFYESWVNKIDIQSLLGTDDLANGEVVSLLDSTIIDQIADYAIVPVPGTARLYISPSLNLFLTVTNVRGVPFSLNGNAPGSAEEDVAYYADRIQFETVSAPGAATESPLAWPLPIGQNGGAWPLLKQAAMATGAFPIFLAPRQLNRAVREYLNSPWEPLSAPPQPVPPHWPLGQNDPYTTLNVDGGVTDNDPFELAHDFLALHNPLAKIDPVTGDSKNPSAPDQANCAVLTVAPFPADDLYNKAYDFTGNSSVLGMLPNLFSVLISQSRFLGETLGDVMSGESFSRFVLAPSDTSNPNGPALQCGSLSAFGGFFLRGFRAHDYQLGRRNCQKFLQDWFRLSEDNPIIAGGLSTFDAATRATVIKNYGSAENGISMMPIIPLCGTAVPPVPEPVRANIIQPQLDAIVQQIVARLKAVAKPLIGTALGGGVEDFAIREAVNLLIDTWAKNKLKAALQKEFGLPG